MAASEQRKAYRKAYYVANRERILAQTKRYAAEHPEVRRAIESRYRAQHPEKIVAQNASYYSENREQLLIRKKEYAVENQLVLRARDQVSRVIKSGKLVSLPCWTCGKDKTVAHHADYAAPLDVVWLCQSHHMQLHRGV